MIKMHKSGGFETNGYRLMVTAKLNILVYAEKNLWLVFWANTSLSQRIGHLHFFNINSYNYNFKSFTLESAKLLSICMVQEYRVSEPRRIYFVPFVCRWYVSKTVKLYLKSLCHLATLDDAWWIYCIHSFS